MCYFQYIETFDYKYTEFIVPFDFYKNLFKIFCTNQIMHCIYTSTSVIF